LGVVVPVQSGTPTRFGQRDHGDNPAAAADRGTPRRRTGRWDDSPPDALPDARIRPWTSQIPPAAQGHLARQATPTPRSTTWIPANLPSLRSRSAPRISRGHPSFYRGLGHRDREGQAAPVLELAAVSVIMLIGLTIARVSHSRILVIQTPEH